MEEVEKLAQGILAREHRAKLVSLVDGKHFTSSDERVKQLKRDGSYAAAECLLLRLERDAGAEAEVMDCEAPPWYSEQLRIVRKKLAAHQRK